MEQMRRVLVAVLVVAVAWLPAATAQDDGNTSDECRRWLETADDKVRSFWENHTAEWQAFAQRMEEEARRFQAEDHTEEETRQFFRNWSDRVESKTQEMASEQQAFHEEMRRGYQEHCGDSTRYEPRRYSYPIEGPGGEDPGDDGPSRDECARHRKQRYQAYRDLKAEHRQEWRAFERRWENRTRNFSQEDHNRTEWEEFNRSREKAARDLEASHEAEIDQLEREHPAKAGCETSDVDDADRPGSCSFDGLHQEVAQFRNEQEQAFRRFHHLQERKIRDHMEEQNRSFHEFARENHTREEWEQFNRSMAEEHRRFMQGIENETQAFQRRQARQLRDFVESQRGDCGDAEARPDGPDGHIRMRHAMKRCMMQVRAEFRQQTDNGTQEPSAEVRAQIRAAMERCRKKVGADWEQQVGREVEGEPLTERMGSWNISFDEADEEIHLEGRYVRLTGDPTSNTMHDVTIRGQVYIETIAPSTHFDRGGFRPGTDDRPSVMVAQGDGVTLRLHDNPTGLIQVRTRAGESLYLTVPDDLDVNATPSGFAIAAGDTRALVRGGNTSWDESDRILTLEGEARFLVPGAENAVLPDSANKHRVEIGEGVEDGKVAGEVSVVKTEPPEQAKAETPDVEVSARDETLTYDDVEIGVQTPAESAVEVTFASKNLTEGKTFVVNVDGDLVSGEISVSHVVVNETSGSEDAAEIRRADDVDDVLDPTDDATAEYVVVKGSDGTQLLVSIPHWSIHKVRVEGTQVDQQKALPAPGTWASVLAVAAAAVALARRRD